MIRYPLVFCLVILSGCNKEHQPSVQEIVDQAIEKHGAKHYKNSLIEFDFRDKHYTSRRTDTGYTYTRTFKDTLGNKVIDKLVDNKKFARMVNSNKAEVNKEWSTRYSNAINSVLYFVQLPFGLNDPAVNKKLLGMTIINDEPYYEIKITFDKEGGGEDYQDVFVYWIHKSRYTLDYFGYQYETDGGGTRFRKAINMRKINNIMFADYINYKGPSKDTPPEILDSLYLSGELEELSRIVNENIKVIALN